MTFNTNKEVVHTNVIVLTPRMTIKFEIHAIFMFALICACCVFGDVGDLIANTYMLMHSIKVFSIILNMKIFGGTHKIVLFNDMYIHLCLLE